MKNKILTITLIVAIALSVVSVSLAGVLSSLTINVENANINIGSAGDDMPVDVTLGGKTQGDWEAVDDIIAGDDLIVADDATISGDTIVEEFTDGGGCWATSTSLTSHTMLEASLLTYNCFEITSNTGNLTWTLPATSTMTTLLATAGKHRSWIFENATTSSATFTIAAGSGIDLIGVTTNDDIIDETEYSELECWRKTDTDVTCRISELLAVD